MIEKIGGYRRYKCKKCREGNQWIWSWRCIHIPKIGARRRDDYSRGSIDNSSYHYDGRLRKKVKPRSKSEISRLNYKKPYSQLDINERVEVDEDYNSDVEDINGNYRLGPAVPQPGVDLMVGKERYRVSLSESLNITDPDNACSRCGYSIVYCEPHWRVTKEHYGYTSRSSNLYHPWCYN